MGQIDGVTYAQEVVDKKKTFHQISIYGDTPKGKKRRRKHISGGGGSGDRGGGFRVNGRGDGRRICPGWEGKAGEGTNPKGGGTLEHRSKD